MKFYLGIIFFFFCGIQIILAQLSLPDIFTDDMVLQRDKPIQFWGKGNPTSEVEVLFAGETKRTEIYKDSTWSIILNKRKANPKPQSIEITSGTKKIVLSNILIGDVWLCIGQSNMEFPMQKEIHFEEERQNADLPLLRFFNTTYAGKNIYNQTFTDSVLRMLNRKNFYQGKWDISDSTSIKQMSAVGYYFGKKILEKEHIPIGLINMAIGGAPIETFIDYNAMAGNPRFSEKVKGNWLDNDSLPVWVRERGHQNLDDTPAYKKDSRHNHAYMPGFAYSAGIAPLTKMPIKGILWYQGESNAQEIGRVNEYGELQKLMVKEYRDQWNDSKMPFYWVQLSSIDTARYDSKYWPKFRDEQRRLLNEIKYSGMAVCSDIGAKNDVHPVDKKEVGNRLARWALHQTYSEQIVPSGPLPKKAIYRNGKILIKFDYATNGLKTSNGKAVRGFSLDGKNEIPANLMDNTVEITTSLKSEFVYYGWQPYSIGNLVNSEELPTSTFKIKVE